MNRIISLFLFIFIASCLNGQYNSPIKNKVTLGKQTTADGLVWRGRLADTANLLTNKLDTSVYIVLDTGTRAMWYYRASTTPKWTRLVDSLNNMQGTLAVANGGTGATSLSPNNYLIRTNSSGIFDTSAVYEAVGNVGIGTTEPSDILHISNNQNAGTRIRISNTNSGTGALAELRMYSDAEINGFAMGTYSSNFNSPSTIAGKSGFYSNTVPLFFNTYIAQPISFLTTNTERMRINSDGNVGIGINAPTAPLDVAETSGIALRLRRIISGNNVDVNFFNPITNAGDVARIRMDGDGYSNEYGALSFWTTRTPNSLVERLRVTSTGNVGIGTASPVVQFHTTGGVRFAGLTSIQDLETDADGNLVSGSDYNLKNSIEPISSGINEVLKLNPVQFYWNKESRNLLNKNYGFIAQDVMVAIPNAASTMGDGYMQVDYNAIVATLTKAIQEQQALIKALEQRILILENK